MPKIKAAKHSNGISTAQSPSEQKFSECLQALSPLMKCGRDSKFLVTYLPDKALRSGHSWKKEENQQRNMGTIRVAGGGLGPSETR